MGFGRKGVSPTSETASETPPSMVGEPVNGRFVYGLNIKPEHGYYVEVEALDGDIDKVCLIDDSPDEGWNPRNMPLAAGRPVDTEHLPTRMKWLDRNRHPIPDFDNGLIVNVSEKARSVIEQVEPDLHQFVPVEYVDRSGEHLENRYFLVVCNRLDSLDHLKTTMVLRNGRVWVPAGDLIRRGEPIPEGFDVDASPKLVFNHLQIGSAHIWVEKHLTGGATFISDVMDEAFRSNNLSGMRSAAIASV